MPATTRPTTEVARVEFSDYKIRKWSIGVRWRDRVCQVCGSREELEAHHLADKSHHPELAYLLDNGVALCGNDKRDGNKCHETFHTKFMGGYRKKCRANDFERFQRLINWATNHNQPATANP